MSGPYDPRTETTQTLAAKAGLAFAEGASGFTFQKGVVREVIHDPSKIDTIKDSYGDIFKNEASQTLWPRKSLLVNILSDPDPNTVTVCYPFFPSHLMLPIKVGEIVWIYNDQAPYSYWLCRISSNNAVEDVNYTHKDREFVSSAITPSDAKAKKDKQEKPTFFLPQFNNGAGPNAETIPGEIDYESINSEAVGAANLIEPIPRLTPRPGDLVLQGSNNASITLGTDRGWAARGEEAPEEKEFEESNANAMQQPESGTIDIVCGRGSGTYYMTPTISAASGSLASLASTDGIIIQNSRNQFELDKNPEINGLIGNPMEGDPHFVGDAARIYVTMNSDMDENFGLNLPIPISGSIASARGAGIVLNSRDIRIASSDSVRLIKRGNSDIKGPASSIIILSDGTIHLTGEQIFIGKSKDNKGLEVPGPGPGESQPYILFSEVKTYLESLHESIDSFCTTLETHTTPGYGVPSPQINAAASTLKTEMATLKDTIDTFQSIRIFGE